MVVEVVEVVVVVAGNGGGSGSGGGGGSGSGGGITFISLLPLSSGSRLQYELERIWQLFFRMELLVVRKTSKYFFEFS